MYDTFAFDTAAIVELFKRKKKEKRNYGGALKLVEAHFDNLITILDISNWKRGNKILDLPKKKKYKILFAIITYIWRIESRLF